MRKIKNSYCDKFSVTMPKHLKEMCDEYCENEKENGNYISRSRFISEVLEDFFDEQK